MNAAIAAGIIGTYDEPSGRFTAQDTKVEGAGASCSVPDICFALDQASGKARFTCGANGKDTLLNTFCSGQRREHEI